jgi:hypothetical protein
MDFSSITGIINTILKAFDMPQTPVTPLPPPLIMTGAKLRPGLSAEKIASQIISRQPNAGRVVGDVFADGPNKDEAMELIRITEIVNALLNEAKVDVVIPPGTAVTTIGVGNLGAPVVSQGATTAMAIGDGIIR